MTIAITPIGVVRSDLRDRRNAPRQAFEGAPAAVLEINPDFAPALHGLRPGTELIDRPNPIGLHRVTVAELTGATTIKVDALEAINGTPILDLKVALNQAPDA